MTPPARKIFHRPRRTVENMVQSVAFLVAVVLLAVAFSTSLRQPVQVSGFKQSGAFSYTANVLHPPAAAYPSGTAVTGDPLFLNLFKLIDLGFSYRFRSTLPHRVHGTIELVANLSVDSNLENRYVLAKTTTFKGDAAKVGGTFDLQGLRKLIGQLTIESGATSASYTINLTPVVHVTGLVAGKQIDSTFSPLLPFTVTDSVLQLNVAQATAPLGATYTLTPGTTAVTTALKPVQAGTIAGFAPNYISFARYHLPVSTLRGLGLGLAGLVLIALLGRLFKPRREVWSNERRIAFRHGSVVIDVKAVGKGPSPGRAPIEVPAFESLAELAQYCERPILREGHEGAYVYAVEDDGLLYLHRPDTETPAGTGVSSGAAQVGEAARVTEVAPVSRAAAAAVGSAREPRARRRLLVRVFGALFALLTAAALVTGFTATNTVSLSHAGVTNPALSVNLGAPAQCAGINLTNLVVAGTSSTWVNGTGGNDLIIGRNDATPLYLSGNGGDDCIVGGGQAGVTNYFNGLSAITNRRSSVATGSANSITIARPSPAAAGDFVLVTVAAHGASARPALCPPAGWTQVGTTSTPGLLSEATFYSVRTSASTESYTFNVTDAGSCSAVSKSYISSAVAFAYQDVDPTSPIDGTPPSPTTGTSGKTLTAPTYVTSVNGDEVVQLYAAGVTSGTSPSLSGVAVTTNSSVSASGIEDAFQATAGTTAAASATAATSGPWVGRTIALSSDSTQTDICLGAPGATNTFTNCDVTAN